MNELTDSNNYTQNVAPSTPVRITPEQCQAMSDAELLEMISRSADHKKDFQSYMNCNFSYNYLCDHLYAMLFKQCSEYPVTVCKCAGECTVVYLSAAARRAGV